MYVVRNALILLTVLLSNLGAFASEFCYARERYPRKLKTAEECAARCTESKLDLHSQSSTLFLCYFTSANEVDGQVCYAWRLKSTGSRCWIYVVERNDRYYGAYEECGALRTLRVNSTKESLDQDAPAPEPTSAGCNIRTYVPLGKHRTDKLCESACIEGKWFEAYGLLLIMTCR